MRGRKNESKRCSRSTSPVGESVVMRCLLPTVPSVHTLPMMTANGDCVPSVSMPSFCLWFCSDFVVLFCTIICKVVVPVLSSFFLSCVEHCHNARRYSLTRRHCRRHNTTENRQHNRQQQTTHSLPQEETKKNVGEKK